MLPILSNEQVLIALIGALGSMALVIGGYVASTLRKLSDSVSELNQKMAGMIGRYDEKFISTEMRFAQLEEDVKEIKKKRFRQSGAI